MEDEAREGAVCTGRLTLPSTRDPLPSSKPQPGDPAQGGDGESASAALVCAAENGDMVWYRCSWLHRRHALCLSLSPSPIARVF